MGVKYNIIVRDSENLEANIKSLSDAELSDQMIICMGICSCILNVGEPDKLNKAIIDYCRTRFGDMMNYTLDLIRAYLERGGTSNTASCNVTAYMTKLEKLKARVEAAKSKIAPHFNADKIDWQYIATL